MTAHTATRLDSRRGGPLAFAVLALVVVAVNLPQSVIVPVVPGIEQSFGTDQVTATWLITAFLLSSGVATPLLGRLGDAYGQRRVLSLALFALIVGSVGAILAPTIGWAIAARFVQGISGGAVPVAFSASRDALPPHRLRYGVAVLATVGSLAFSGGIVAAGPLLSTLGLASLFVLTGVVAVIAAIAVLAVLPPDRPRLAPARFGLLPVVLLSAGLVTLLLTISQSSSRGWGSPQVLGLFAAALLLLIGWAGTERRSATPFIDLEMMRARGVWTSNLVAFLAGLGLFGCAAGLPALLQVPPSAGYGIGADLDTVGLFMAPIALCAFGASLCTGMLHRRLAPRTILTVGGMTSASTYAAIALWHDDPVVMIGWGALQGVGNGLILSTVASVVVDSVPAEQTGIASGMNTNIRALGGSVGAAATASILGSHTHAGTIAEGGFVLAFALMAAATALAALAGLLIPAPRAWTRPELTPQSGLPAPR